MAFGVLQFVTYRSDRQRDIDDQKFRSGVNAQLKQIIGETDPAKKKRDAIKLQQTMGVQPSKPVGKPGPKANEPAPGSDKPLLREVQDWQGELCGFVRQWNVEETSLENFYGPNQPDTLFHIGNLHADKTVIYFRDYADRSNELRMKLEAHVADPESVSIDYLEKPLHASENGRPYLTSSDVMAVCKDFTGLCRRLSNNRAVHNRGPGNSK